MENGRAQLLLVNVRNYSHRHSVLFTMHHDCLIFQPFVVIIFIPHQMDSYMLLSKQLDLKQHMSVSKASFWRVLSTGHVTRGATGVERNQCAEVCILVAVCAYQCPMHIIIVMQFTGITCELLTSPANGAVSTTGRVFGSKARYRCQPGYTLHGDDIRICQEVGYWSGQTPSCVCENTASSCSVILVQMFIFVPQLMDAATWRIPYMGMLQSQGRVWALLLHTCVTMVMY